MEPNPRGRGRRIRSSRPVSLTNVVRPAWVPGKPTKKKKRRRERKEEIEEEEEEEEKNC